MGTGNHHSRRLTSRERMLTCFRHQEPDHVPLLFHPFGFRPPPQFRWSNAFEQAQVWLSLGVDAWLWAEPPLQFHPDVKVRRREETIEGAPWPVMVAEYDTPAGMLRQQVYRTDDWVSAEWPMHKDGDPGVQLFDDYNVPRYRQCPIETEADLEKLRYLLHPLTDQAITEVRQRVGAVAQPARDLGVLLVGQASSGTDAAVWLCGVQGLLDLALDRPEMFDALLEIIHTWDQRNVEVLLDTPVDLIMRRGYYEGTTFWSPSLFRQFFAPRIRELTDLAHQADRLMGYTMSVGVMPILDQLIEIGYDVHYLLDPLPHGQPIDLPQVKAATHGRLAIAGGLNTPITLEQGSSEQIHQAVQDAVRALAPGGGFVLSSAEGIFSTTPWESIETVIEAWKEIGRYPLLGAQPP